MQKSRRKNYFVRYNKDADDSYNLRWCYEKNKAAKAKLEQAGYERIDKKSAMLLAYRGYVMHPFNYESRDDADKVIYPWNYDAARDEYDRADLGLGRQYRFYEEDFIILRYRKI